MTTDQIMLTSSVGVEMPVNLAQLRLFKSGILTIPDTYWVVLRLVTCESDEKGWTLTQLGEDLLASEIEP